MSWVSSLISYFFYSTLNFLSFKDGIVSSGLNRNFRSTWKPFCSSCPSLPNWGGSSSAYSLVSNVPELNPEKLNFCAFLFRGAGGTLVYPNCWDGIIESPAPLVWESGGTRENVEIPKSGCDPIFSSSSYKNFLESSFSSSLEKAKDGDAWLRCTSSTVSSLY